MVELAVTFTGDQILYGSYGGTEGKPAGIGTMLLNGVFSIDSCQQSPIIIHYGTSSAALQFVQS